MNRLWALCVLCTSTLCPSHVRIRPTRDCVCVCGVFQALHHHHKNKRLELVSYKASRAFSVVTDTLNDTPQAAAAAAARLNTHTLLASIPAPLKSRFDSHARRRRQ